VGAEAPTYTGSSDLRALPSAFNAKAQISGAKALDVAAKALKFKAKAHSLHATAVHLSAKAERQKHQKIQSHVTENQKRNRHPELLGCPGPNIKYALNNV